MMVVSHLVVFVPHRTLVQKGYLLNSRRYLLNCKFLVQNLAIFFDCFSMTVVSYRAVLGKCRALSL